MPVLLLFAFLSGLVTIFAPCIWPLLPIVLSSGALGGHRRPLGLTLGILISFGIITLSISYLVKIIGFDANILRTLSVAILLILGFTLVFPPMTRLVEGFVSALSGKFGGVHGQNSNGFWGGFITGLALGVVWAPCAGPILATIATLAATRAVGPQIILVTIVYLIGIGIPLFIFTYAGQRFIQKSRVFSKYTGTIQKIFGIIIILTALLIFTNYDKVIEAKLLDAVPSYSNFLTRLEGNSLVTNELNSIKGSNKSSVKTGQPFNPMPGSTQSNLFNTNYPAPGFSGGTTWLNTPDGKALTLQDLKGKVVLVDFWTYTCINCIRTLPFVTSWYNKYNKAGFVVVGVHTPEFQFEHETSNVENAIKQFGIKYPVVQDNNYAIWNNYNNQYWPAEYLIDKNGNVRRTHFGEGEYDQTEMAIRELLKENGASLSAGLVKMPDQTPQGQISPETYVGANRMQYYYPDGSIASGNYPNLKVATGIPVNSFTLGGNWDIADEYATANQNAALEYNFYADHVYLVMKPSANGSGTVKVFLDGKPISSNNAGADVKDGSVTIDSDRLYNLVDLKNNPGQHLLRLEFSPGIQVFAFTFG